MTQGKILSSFTVVAPDDYYSTNPSTMHKTNDTAIRLEIHIILGAVCLLYIYIFIVRVYTEDRIVHIFVYKALCRSPNPSAGAMEWLR